MKTGFIILLLLSGFGGVLTVLFAGGSDSHHFNLRYLAWKAGWVEFENPLRFFGVDRGLRERLIGKSPADLRQWFPQLKPMSEANGHQSQYPPEQKNQEVWWLGESWWYAVVKNGRIADFELAKG